MTMPEDIRKFVSVFVVAKYGKKGEGKRLYYVDYDEVDVVEKYFYKSRVLDVFTDAKKANAYARKKAKELEAEVDLVETIKPGQRSFVK